MPHNFTKEDRARGRATRLRNLEQKRLKEQQEIVATATTELSMDRDASVPMPPALRERREQARQLQAVYDWWEAPLKDAVEKLNNMKRDYDRAAQIVLQRQSQQPQAPLTCWVWENRMRPDMPKTAVAGCKRSIADASKAAFRNDGFKDKPGDPNEKIRSIYCCSMVCFQAYQQLRPVGGLSRH